MTEYTENDDGTVSPNATNAPVNENSDLEIIGAEEAFFVQRDENGELVPKELPIPGMDGKGVRVKPAPSGVYEQYMDPVEWDDSEQLSQLLNKQFPDLNVTGEKLDRDLYSFSARTMVRLIRKASGEDMQHALENEQMQSQVGQMADAFGIDTSDADITDLLEMGGGTTSDGVMQAAEQAGIDASEASVEDLAAALEENEQAAVGGPNGL